MEQARRQWASSLGGYASGHYSQAKSPAPATSRGLTLKAGNGWLVSSHHFAVVGDKALRQLHNQPFAGFSQQLLAEALQAAVLVL